MLLGSCLCGQIRYKLRATPEAMYYCHCGTCRKASGSSFATNLAVSARDFVLVSGEHLLSSFQSSPGKRRYFCAVCGSPIYSQTVNTIDMVSVRCGTLDTDPGIWPSRHEYVASKALWFEICDGLPAWPQLP